MLQALKLRPGVLHGTLLVLATGVTALPAATEEAPARILAASSWGAATPIGLSQVTAAVAPATGVLASSGSGYASHEEVEALRQEIAGLRQEVSRGRTDMWSAMKTISQSVERSEVEMKALTKDVGMLRGRQGGVPTYAGAPPVSIPSGCDSRQASCAECVGCISCVWCAVEQRCVPGDAAGPVRGECALFRHNVC
eukprot:TRINITY_DN102606_c0_g1_i1.p1 TRINITY_DN102606_c0_g1~~TRINITY_DN102606_c0_g1_i1.p1  ORF type:complete len:196 (-),score=30.52 TRINITY_DN102606_c0_g1_i1:88-675(-)